MRLVRLFALPMFLSSTSSFAARGEFLDATTLFARRGEAMTTQEFEKGEAELNRQFNTLCGDTYCEGDFGNLTPLGLTCSINDVTKAVGECVWEFAGSYAEVDSETGKLRMVAKTFACNIGFRGDAADLAHFLLQGEGADLLAFDGLAVPGAEHTLYDVLGACL